ncbi:MAG: EamA family transporter [Burkholderiales bacterium]|nr:EamA family transporter [Burkholderiales bacterium]
MNYLYVLMTVALTVYGQIVIKWQVLKAGSMPTDSAEKLKFLFHLVLNPWLLSAFLAAFLASVTWMAAMTKLQLSHAYPFMSLAFVMVILLSNLFFGEPINAYKLAGVLIVMAGLAIGSQG